MDINVDIAEGFPWDEELLQLASSANVCCGAHAGSPQLTTATFNRCRELGVRIGLHPGYPDRFAMGRDPVMKVDLQGESLVEVMWRQVERFVFVASYIKPHGAFYHESAKLPVVAQALEAMLDRSRLPLMGLPQGGHAAIAAKVGVPFIREGFADRRYGKDGFLVSRNEPDAVLTDHATIAKQSLALSSEVDSICVHGDNPDALLVAATVRRALLRAGHEVGW